MARSETERLISVALLTSLALISGLLEGRFPLPLPGMRLGVANVFTLVALILFGAREAAAVASLKIALAFLLTGNIFAGACSLAGTLLSLPVSIALYSYRDRSVGIPAVSVASAAAFNVGQIGAVAAIVSEPMVFSYLPLLLLVACVTGFAVGVLADKLSSRLARYLETGRSRR